MYPRHSHWIAGPGTPARPAQRPIRLEAVNLTKLFGSFTANQDVNLRLHHGEVHVLLGENGAGKSTFMNMLYGQLTPDSGAIAVDDREVVIDSPAAALERGIGMVQQHFALVPSLTVAQNVVLGAEARRVRYSPREVERQVRATVERVGWDIDITARVSDLAVSAQQRVEILKLLHRGATTLLLDEPTALLSPVEIDNLLTIVRGLRDDGCSILLVTHKLREVEEVADAITVLRQGVVTGRFDAAQIDARQIATAMTGRDEIPAVTTDGRVPADAEVALVVEGLTVAADHGVGLHGVSFSVRAGEVVGIAAVEGNGQHELVQALTGVAESTGTVLLGGTDVSSASSLKRRRAGLGVIPADRRHEGVVEPMNLVENFAINAVAAGGYRRRGGLLHWRRMREDATRAVRAYDVRPGRVGATAGSLSGGNMQKLVIARELEASPRVVVASSPTWGLDVGAVADVQQRLVALRDGGAAIVLSSPDLDEIVALSDVILVLYRGRIVASFRRDSLDMAELSLALIGSGGADVAA